MRFYFGWKSHFGVQSALYLCSQELSRNETQNGMDFILVILTEIKFKNGMRFSCEHNLSETEWISADPLDVALMRMCIWNSMRVWISYRSFWQKWNFISGDKILCKRYPKKNAYTCPWKFRVVLKYSWNETSCEENLSHAGLKSQTGMCSFRLSCERTLRITSLKRPLTEHLCWLSHIFWFLYWIYDTTILEIISEHLNRKSLKEERVL